MVFDYRITFSKEDGHQAEQTWEEAMRGFALGFLAAIVTTGATAAQIQQKPLEIIMVAHMPAANDFTAVVRNGAELAAKQMGVHLQFLTNETFDMVWMSQTLGAAVGKKPDGIATTLPDAAALGDSIKLAVNAGIPVVVYNGGARDFEKLGALTYIGQDNYEAGVDAGKRVKAAGASHGVCVNNQLGNVDLDDRCRGFADGFGGATEVLGTTEDPIEMRDAVTAYLNKHPQVDAMLGLWAGRIDALVDGTKMADRLGKVKIATFDLSDSALKYIKDGTVLFGIDQQQFLQGYLPVVLLANKIRYGLLPANKVISSGPAFVDKDTAGSVIELVKEGVR
jgi:simple sugar transport system substrate-binding protein